jgi:hypothetical protein
VNPYQGTFGGSRDAFVTKVNATGNALSYSTYLGGSDADYGYGISVDTSGNAYVTGYTESIDFPIENPYQGTYGGGTDAFVTKLAATTKTLAVDFGSSGLYYYVGGTNPWKKIAGSNPTMLACCDNTLYAKFSSGLYKHITGTNWDKIAGSVAQDMICCNDTLYVDFGPSGPYKYVGGASPWEKIAGSNPTMLACCDNTLYAKFSTGLYKHVTGTDWDKIAGSVAQDMICCNDILYVDFGSSGLYKYVGGASPWEKIAGSNPTMLACCDNILYAKFSSGLYKHNTGTNWDKIAGSVAQDMICCNDTLYVDFGPSGLYEYVGGASPWEKIAGSNPTMLACCADTLYAKFSSGLYQHDDGTNWTRIATANTEDMVCY